MKFHGEIGFAITKETSPGVWTNEITVREYKGDVLRLTKRYQTSTDKVNDDIDISNQISIIADPFINENFYFIRYVTFMNQKWKVSSVDFAYPRINLTIGGLYNGETD